MRWSFSKWSTLEMCPRKFEKKYILKEYIPQKSDALAIGSGLDLFLEAYAWNHSLTIQDAHEIFMAGCLEENKLVNPSLPKKFLPMVTAYIKNGKPLTPWETQKEFNIELADDCYLTGFVDIITKRKEKPFAIVDNKSSKNLYSQTEVDDALNGKGVQLTMYFMGLLEEYGPLEIVGYHVLLKDPSLWSTPAFIQNVASKRTIKQANQLKKRIVKVDRRIKEGCDFIKRPSRLCPYCEYKGKC